MADILNKLKHQKHCKTEIPRNQKLILTAYTKQIESLIASMGEHSIFAQRAEKAMSLQEVELRQGKSPEINGL